MYGDITAITVTGIAGRIDISGSSPELNGVKKELELIDGAGEFGAAAGQVLH
jgi:hypothetical protein